MLILLSFRVNISHSIGAPGGLRSKKSSTVLTSIGNAFNELPLVFANLKLGNENHPGEIEVSSSHNRVLSKTRS